eukprot:TRINITY_DN7858_c0_g1_i2.p1 TRINITY_DN7858_c0_g1~~TRINITY_DN7858_c0_g1_i2.p1  ORF type:complete len:205 (+),score=47.75 TRINITY_DN7858_c0_g1_i2:174-788(+)
MAAVAAVVIRHRRNSGGAAIAPTRLSDAEQKRREAALKEYRLKVKMTKILQKYDSNKSKKLEPDQVKQLLTDMDISTPPGTEPSQEELDWVLKVADVSGDGSIDANELTEAMGCWQTFVDNRERLQQVMAKFDVSKSGTLSKAEVRPYLVELNGGNEVTDEEVDMVFKAADAKGDGVLSLTELSQATVFWYGHVERRKECCSIL